MALELANSKPLLPKASCKPSSRLKGLQVLSGADVLDASDKDVFRCLGTDDEDYESQLQKVGQSNQLWALLADQERSKDLILPDGRRLLIFALSGRRWGLLLSFAIMEGRRPPGQGGSNPLVFMVSMFAIWILAKESLSRRPTSFFQPDCHVLHSQTC
jgi:hypothetical protein